MKKSTQKMMMALSIVFIFALSSIAFVFSGFPAQQQQLEPLSSFVVDGEIDPRLEDAYVQNGFTFLKLYYSNETGREITSLVESAPNSFSTPDGQRQLISQKISSQASYVKILNLNGEYDIFNLTPDGIIGAVCERLVVQSTECALISLNFSR